MNIPSGDNRLEPQLNPYKAKQPLPCGVRERLFFLREEARSRLHQLHRSNAGIIILIRREGRLRFLPVLLDDYLILLVSRQPQVDKPIRPGHLYFIQHDISVRIGNADVKLLIDQFPLAARQTVNLAGMRILLIRCDGNKKFTFGQVVDHFFPPVGHNELV